MQDFAHSIIAGFAVVEVWRQCSAALVSPEPRPRLPLRTVVEGRIEAPRFDDVTGDVTAVEADPPAADFHDAGDGAVI